MENEIKLTIVGDENTGKTMFSFIINKNYSYTFDEYYPSLTAQYLQKKIIFNNTIFSICIWDTAGKEKYTALSKIFFMDADIIFIFFNNNDRKSFERAKVYFELVKNKFENIENIIIFLIANKYDLTKGSEENIVTDEEVFEFVDKNNSYYKII